MKIVEFIKNDMIGLCAYNVGDIAGWPDEIADRLIARGFAKLHGDGKVKQVGRKIPDDIGSGYWAGAAVADHIAALKQR
jgi:hypothetical protein